MIDDIIGRLERLESLVMVLVGRQQVQDFYSTEQFARLVGLSDWTVRNYCRLGRLRAVKKRSGRGATPEWAISHAELERYRRDGLLDR
jgi:hypothetical protein